MYTLPLRKLLANHAGLLRILQKCRNYLPGLIASQAKLENIPEPCLSAVRLACQVQRRKVA